MDHRCKILADDMHRTALKSMGILGTEFVVTSE